MQFISLAAGMGCRYHPAMLKPLARLLGFLLILLPASGQVYAQSKLSPAEDATRAVDSRLSGKTASPETVNLFATSDYALGQDFVRNPHLWCADLAVYLTCFSPWNALDHPYQGGTLVTPKNALFAEHFSGVHGSKPLHRGNIVEFVGAKGTLYWRTLVETPVEVGSTDICVGTFAEGPLPPDVVPAEVLPAGLPADFLPPGTPVLFSNKNKEVRVAEVVSFAACAIAPARPANRAPWTTGGPAVLGDSGSPVFVVLNGRPVLWWLFHSAGSGPSISDQISGINHLLARGYTLKVADVRVK